MSSPVLMLEKTGAVATVTLNRPESMNALSQALRVAISQAFRDLQSDETIRVAILTGAGRAFCAGFDLKEMAMGSPDRTADSVASDMAAAIDAFEGPIIAAVNGHAITGGFELALACDVIIASTEAKFADTHVRVGILPGWGLSQKLPRLIGISRAKELSLTGNTLGADDALAWGLVNHVVPAPELLATCRALAEDMVSCVPGILKSYKQLIDRGAALPLAEALALETKLSLESAREITASTIGARRAGIQQRGRKQTRE